MHIIDDQDAAIACVERESGFLCKLSLGVNDNEFILLNKAAVEFLTSTLEEMASEMEDDPNVDAPAIYDPIKKLPWWMTMFSKDRNE